MRWFKLSNIDIAPTIEEFACLLRLLMRKDSVVYLCLEKHLFEIKGIEQFGELLGVLMAQVRLTRHTDSWGLTKAFVEAYLRELGCL